MSSHALNPSIYQPLDNPSQEIRLLQIKGSPIFSYELITPVTLAGFLSDFVYPPPRQMRAPIKCRLLTFKLDEAPPYKALSYTWGSPDPAGTIWVDDHGIPVGQNLFTALQRFYEDPLIEYLWADALCINQGDDEEKSRQVPLMSQIYSRAKGVLIWLGEELSSTAKTFSFMETSLSYALEVLDGMEADYQNGGSIFPWMEAFMPEKIESLNDDSNKRAMKELCENPYWRRVWVLQEFPHASRCHLICGRHNFDMNDMAAFLFFWETASKLQSDLAGSSDWHANVFRPLIEFLLIKTNTADGQADTFNFHKDKGFRHHTKLDASGLKDPLYSFSGKHLTAKGFSFDEIVKMAQVPSVEMLDPIAMSLGLLGETQKGQEGIYKQLFRAIFPPQLIEPHTPAYESSDRWWMGERLLASGFMLCLGGPSRTSSFCKKIDNELASRKREGQNPTMVEALQFIAAEGNPALSYIYSACYENNIKGVSQTDDSVALQSIGDQLYAQATRAFGTRVDEDGSDTGEEYLFAFHKPTRFKNLWVSRAFAITERGYMGFVQPGTRVGDKVCILYGCPSPLVIRPDEGEYLLVGDCCFEGTMRGEMVKKQEEGEFVLQDFTFK
ncbi:HET domain-containing protein [Fusarium sp. LHS14.1]|nr:HET domain-containing protein [Fusarium sp. LHS14.1]